jgi:hypothetical protein
MKRASGLLPMLCLALSVAACGDPQSAPGSIPGDVLDRRSSPQSQTLPPPSPAAPQFPFDPGWALTATVTTLTGPGQACLEWPTPFVEQHDAYLTITGETIKIIVNNNGFQSVPEEFDGKVVGRDFTASGPRSIVYDEPTVCRDGTILHSGPVVDVRGRLSEDGLELTASMHERWGTSLDHLDTTKTWTWTAVRR